MMRIRVLSTTVALVTVACGKDQCVIPPCPPPFAIRLTVTSQPTSATVNATVTVTVAGAGSQTVPCNAECTIPGYPGAYHLKVSAPGFVTSERDVNVTGNMPQDCGCELSNTETLAIALTPG